MRDYQICSKTVMDTSDSKIEFDNLGVCDHANNFYQNILPNWNTNEQGKSDLNKIISKIKKEGENKDFDCILGLSGGLDSSYMLHLIVTEFGLRPLVFHVDGGWNSEIAVHNIQALIEKLNLDLYTEVINWEEMRDFQLAWFKSGLPHIDLPQDHAFVATLYNFADKYNIKYILNGGNYSTECIKNPMEFFYYGTDMIHIRQIIKKFGEIKMETFPFSSIYRHKIYLAYIRGIKVIKPLNYLPFTKQLAIKTLKDIYNWKSYPQKHFESRFTKFYEGYWLPNRFGFDVRRVQFSSLILTNQMTREEALELLKSPPISDDEAKNDFRYVANKLRISQEELNKYFQMPKKFYWEYDSQESIFNLGAKVLKSLGIERSIRR